MATTLCLLVIFLCVLSIYVILSGNKVKLMPAVFVINDKLCITILALDVIGEKTVTHLALAEIQLGWISFSIQPFLKVKLQKS